MHRRHLLLAALPLPALAHHGWSSFDQNSPIYLVGTADKVRWANPHAELQLQRDLQAPLPPDLSKRQLPAQSAAVDTNGLLGKARLPRRGDARWEIELAPLSRMNAWGVPEVKNGERIELLGFSFSDEKGEAILRAEFVWVNGKAYGLRSSPA
jgi:hypothetical protein